LEKIPISYREKVEARYIKKGRGPCWMWEGSLSHGRPAINLRHVLRYIYEWERGPIPAGHTLKRTDHQFPTCLDLAGECRHHLCVNPWHVTPRPNRWGIYPRERNWDGTKTDHTLLYLHTQRASGPHRKEEHDRNGDSQGGPAEGDG
jgi:hypothetical protein